MLRSSHRRAAGAVLAVAALTHRQVAPATYDVDVALGGGRRLTSDRQRLELLFASYANLLQ